MPDTVEVKADKVSAKLYERDAVALEDLRRQLRRGGHKAASIADAVAHLITGSTPSAETAPSDTLSGCGLTAEERRVVETVIAILRDNRPEVRNSAGLIKGRVQEFRTYFSQEATAREKAADVDQARIQPSRSRKVG